MARGAKTKRPERLPNGPMNYAPENENGVVFLFADLAKHWRLRIEKIKPGFPDCIAYQKSHSGDKRIRIEFEFKSRNFLIHRHDSKKCDWIVCWEHNWTYAPKRLGIVELRREFGLGFNIWLMPVNKKWQTDLDRKLSVDWSVPGQANKDDLLLMYFAGNDKKSINYIYKCKERAYKKLHVDFKKGPDYRAHIKRVCKLSAPLFLKDIKNHRILRTAGFVRADLRGRPNVTEYWPYLYDLIIRRNPSLKQMLKKKYSPDRLN
jgi:hypothetical protein